MLGRATIRLGIGPHSSIVKRYNRSNDCLESQMSHVTQEFPALSNWLSCRRDYAERPRNMTYQLKSCQLLYNCPFEMVSKLQYVKTLKVIQGRRKRFCSIGHVSLISLANRLWENLLFCLPPFPRYFSVTTFSEYMTGWSLRSPSASLEQLIYLRICYVRFPIRV